MTDHGFTTSPESTGTAAIAAALSATLGLAAASWVVAVWQMRGMDMGVATRLGSFAAVYCCTGRTGLLPPRSW